MQHFKDSSGTIWAFEDDVVVELKDGKYKFASASGTPLMIPDDLQPSDPPVPATPTIEEMRAIKWAQIKAEREKRKAGGVKVGDYWFHSDDSSRIQQLGLVMFGVSVPPVQWKTMSGEFVAMTQELADQIFRSVATADQVIFAKAEEHKAAMTAASDPANYDFSGGWPAIYGE